MNKILLAAMISAVVLVAGCTTTAQPGGNLPTINGTNEKIFYMDSFYPQFSLKEIAVNAGDRVKIYVNDTSGNHDFNIDEFNVHSETPAGQVTLVEFIVNRPGEFVYYCSKPGHRAAGQWGTLTVLG